MRAEIRDQVRILYDQRCGYCSVRESDAGARLTLDHFRPRSLGGGDEIDNLVYCCHGCNEFKSDYWHEEETLSLLHPSRDPIAAHIAQTETGRVRALTDRGNRHIECLRLNRPELIAYRLQRQVEEALSRENQQVLQLLETLRQDNEALREQIASKETPPKGR